MKNIFLIAVLFFVISNSYAQKPTDVVATVGSEKITFDEFTKRYNEVKSQTLNPPPKHVFLEDLVRYKIGLQEAEKRNVKNDPIVQERIKQELYKALIEKELGDRVNKIKINENEMKAFYNDNPEIRTSHILIEIKPGANTEERAAAKKRASEILSEVRGSKRSFEELVGLYTDDVATKAIGGDIGWQTKVTLVPNYYKVAESMRIGQISDLIETEYGFHIIKLTGKHSYQEANKRQLRAAVFEQKRKQIFDDYFAKLRGQYKIQTNPSLIK